MAGSLFSGISPKWCFFNGEILSSWDQFNMSFQSSVWFIFFYPVEFTSVIEEFSFFPGRVSIYRPCIGILGPKIGYFLYLSIFNFVGMKISISIPPSRRNLNRGICHTLIFVPNLFPHSPCHPVHFYLTLTSLLGTSFCRFLFLQTNEESPV